MKKTIRVIIAFVLTITLANAQQKKAVYQFSLNLKEVKDDKLFIELTSPKIETKTVLYHLPKVVPGTYAIHNYGAFVSDFKAFDKKGKALAVKKLDKNTWEIGKAQKLAKITYFVDDTWTNPESEEDIFEPAGTEFEANEFFVLNNFGLFGYFKDLENLAYEVNITKPTALYGATALEDLDKTAEKDVFKTKDYHRLADSPIMYCQPDTVWLKASNTDVLVAVYSPNQKVKAQTLAKEIAPMLKAQQEYLGGTLPVDKYAYLFLLSDMKGQTRYGALEHSYSSFFFLPEKMSEARLLETVKHASAHEFFHVVTPLNIHSEEIGNFDYINPKMSKHLWFYEGLTEYASLHAQIKGGLMTLEEFLPAIGEKIKAMREKFNDSLPFTEMSEFVLDKHKDQYLNVYEKGTLIALCLDIKLRELSGGKYGTQDLVRDLSAKYGKDKSFKDDEFFDEITAMTYPEIREFFRKYVEGTEPLPISEILKAVGIGFGDKVKKEIRIYDAISHNFTNEYYGFENFRGEPYELTELGKALGFQSSDLLVSVNGVSYFVGRMDNPTAEKIEATGKLMDKANAELDKKLKVGEPVNVVVLRKQADGSRKEVTLTTTAFEEDHVMKDRWDIYYQDEEKVKLRNIWLGIKK